MNVDSDRCQRQTDDSDKHGKNTDDSEDTDRHGLERSGASGGSITCCNNTDRGSRKRLDYDDGELKLRNAEA